MSGPDQYGPSCVIFSSSFKQSDVSFISEFDHNFALFILND